MTASAAGDQSGRDQVGHRRHGERLERVDFLVDPHRTELRGKTATDGRGQSDAGDDRRNLASVEVRGDETGVDRGAEAVERGVALLADLETGEEGQEDDDDDRAADDRQGTGAEGDLGQQPQDFTSVADDVPCTTSRSCGRRTTPGGRVRPGCPGPAARSGIPGARRAASVPRGPRCDRRPSRAPSAGRFADRAARPRNSWRTSSMKVKTTDSFTASPTPLGPPLAFSPLYEAISPAIRPKTNAFISACTMSLVCASSVKDAKYGPGDPCCTMTLKK